MKSLLISLAAFLALFFVTVATAQTTPSVYHPPEWFVRNNALVAIESDLGGVYIHVHGAHTDLDTNVTIWQWVDQANLKWYIRPGPYADGIQWYYLVSALQSDRVLHQSGALMTRDAPVTLWQLGDYPNAQVRFVPIGDSYYIVFRHSGMGVHVHGAHRDNDTPITQWTLTDVPNLRWKFAEVPSAAPPAPTTPIVLEGGMMNFGSDSEISGYSKLTIYANGTLLLEGYFSRDREEHFGFHRPGGPGNGQDRNRASIAYVIKTNSGLALAVAHTENLGGRGGDRRDNFSLIGRWDTAVPALYRDMQNSNYVWRSGAQAGRNVAALLADLGRQIGIPANTAVATLIL